MAFTLEQLNQLVLERAGASPDESYTAKLIAKGAARCAQKLGEEAVEAAIAAVTGNKTGLAAEAGDVLFHLLVLLRAADVSLDAVMDDLQSRTAQSGLAEKASRQDHGH